MATPRSHIEIAFSSIRVFADDGKLDVSELNFLLGLALRDQVVDDDEKRVLARIFAEAGKSAIDPTVAARIDEARRKHGIPA